MLFEPPAMRHGNHVHEPMCPREPRGFQGLHHVSPNPNIYNNLGNLLSLKKQSRRFQQMLFGHSFGTAEKQER